MPRDRRAADAELRVVEVRAASRLHFGMLSFGQRSLRQFGGAGVMIDEPSLRLRISACPEFQVVGSAADRVCQFVGRLCQAWSWDYPPACRIDVLEAPRQHAGFGTGTQLGVALAAALARWHGKYDPSIEDQALAVGRAQRSAIGTWGFKLGGLLIEGGRENDEFANNAQALSPLVERIELPQQWRWVLVTPSSITGLSGEREREAFSRLPPVPIAITERLCDELWNKLLPSARRCNFQDFSASLYRYGKTAGDCFAVVQGGPFANERVGALVALIRALGIEGVGQTSWGPTVFALVSDESRARAFVDRLKSAPEAAEAEIQIASTCNRGAKIVES